jgi:hypothetical protein
MTETPLADSTGAAQSCPIPLVGDSAAECPVPRVGSDDSATRVFSQSVLISGIRCVLAYVIFPWVLPLLGVAGGVGPFIGLVVSVVAIGFNVASIRRFWVADHRWKWPITVINCSVIGLLLYLLISDLGSL